MKRHDVRTALRGPVEDPDSLVLGPPGHCRIHADLELRRVALGKQALEPGLRLRPDAAAADLVELRPDRVERKHDGAVLAEYEIEHPVGEQRSVVLNLDVAAMLGDTLEHGLDVRVE